MILSLLGSLLTAADPRTKIFDMDTLRDPKTLSAEVLQDWHLVEGPVPTRQKFVTISVGKLWSGQDYRVPVRLVGPAEGKAKGFHLTGGNNVTELANDRIHGDRLFIDCRLETGDEACFMANLKAINSRPPRIHNKCLAYRISRPQNCRAIA